MRAPVLVWRPPASEESSNLQGVLHPCRVRAVPTELLDETGENLRKAGHEFGATTGRPRRCGWLDLPALKHACMLNGATQLCMMKADVLDSFDEVQALRNTKSMVSAQATFPICWKRGLVKPLFESRPDGRVPVNLARVTSFHRACSTMSRKSKSTRTPIRILVSMGPDRAQTHEFEPSMA